MIRFESDYSEGAHQSILDLLLETNMEQTSGYGVDYHCENAREYIKGYCQDDSLDVHFLVGGTQANTTVIASILKPYQGVISANTGHINVHETGAIEATGHRVISLHSDDGKLTANQVREAYDSHWNDATHEHMVQPGMVYISHPTENGTIYSKKELEEISKVCQNLKLPLFMDGARMGYGLMADGNDLTLPEISRLCDVFYIGGTKVGALFGEAIVIRNENLKKDFRYNIKQRGGMLAKGRLLGIQFEALFRDGLYFEISKNAIKTAMMIRDAFREKGIDFLYDSPTNQQFPILTHQQIEKLSEDYSFQHWAGVDEERSAVRFCTSWTTDEANVRRLVKDINKL
ncbi:threonine aldolase family protein [Gudongella sp. SC589]|jgi:threonine aldolase|uniref:threonine aldolase family protein n=1 Tax=Gudongella sp. SC589 TaxID=3385990 RepID=UPI0039047C44